MANKVNTRKLKKITNNKEFMENVNPIIIYEKVQRMKQFIQHGNTSCFEHCYMASYYTYFICKKLHLDYKSASKAAMLHDFFLYNWRIKEDYHRLHAFTHGKMACKNACLEFDLNDKEKEMITKHMWPITVIPPKYKETYILTLVDKYCTMEELFVYYRSLFMYAMTYKIKYNIICSI